LRPTSFSGVVVTVLLRRLPYGDPAHCCFRLNCVRPDNADRTSPVVSLTDIAEWKARTAIESMGAFAFTELRLVGDQRTSR
jgi:hypothetical protein